MPLDTAVIREAIANRIQTVCGITAYPFDVASTVYPRAIVMPGGPAVEYHSSYGQSLATLKFEVEVRTVAADPIPAQRTLATFVDTAVPTSVIDALERVDSPATTPTLGGVVENVMVESVALPPGVQLTEGGLEFTALFTVSVLARRT